ncbi:MAG: septum site-determining protein MinD [Clostridia bacterium]|nr:septum site-determining protein MinD [Clostridia bacterium]
MARRIVITSGKGGVGKTTCSALLGAELAKLGARVVLLDCDVGLNNLDLAVGVETLVNYDIVDVVESKCRIRQALIQHPKLPLLYILPSAHCNNTGKVTGENINSILEELSKTFDYILIDCPAGIGMQFHNAVFGASEAIIVTTPHLIAVRDAGKVAHLLCGYNLVSVGLVVNRIRNDLISKKFMLSSEEIASSLDLKLLGTIHESDQITAVSSVYGNLFSIKDNTILDFQKLAKNVHLCKSQEILPRGFWGIKRKKGV